MDNNALLLIEEQKCFELQQNMTRPIKAEVSENIGHLEEMLRTLRFDSLCSTVRLDGWRALLGENSRQPGQRDEGKADIRSLRLYRAVITGDAKGLRTLLKRNYIDLDVFYNVNREELQWQANTATTFGPSGTTLFSRVTVLLKLSYI